VQVRTLREEPPRQRCDEEDADGRVRRDALPAAEVADGQRRADAEDHDGRVNDPRAVEGGDEQGEEPRRPRAAEAAVADAFADERPVARDDEEAQHRAGE
jgi:hypothetical protein